MTDATEAWLSRFEERMGKARLLISQGEIQAPKICPCGASHNGPGPLCRKCLGFEKRELER